MKLALEQIKNVRESLKNRMLLPPKELYAAYLQFWRRPDDEEINGSIWQVPIHKDPKVRYFYTQTRGTHNDYSCVVPFKTQGCRTWEWDDFEGNFSKPTDMNMNVKGLRIPISALSAVTLIAMDVRYRKRDFYLQRVPSRNLPGLVFRVSYDGCYGWNQSEGDFNEWLASHAHPYFHPKLERAVWDDEEATYFRIISKTSALLAQKALDGKCDYYINPTFGVSYAVTNEEYMRWQDDDFTLQMTAGEKELVNRGGSVKVDREEASVYMLEYEDMYWDMIEYYAEWDHEIQADIARGK